MCASSTNKVTIAAQKLFGLSVAKSKIVCVNLWVFNT